MCAKQLYVKSNGQWVAAGGAGGSVDTAGLATEQFVTDAIGAGGFATLTDLNDALANIPESAITLHAGAVPDAGADTPHGLEDGFSVLDDGLHYFRDVGTLVSITRQEYQTTITLTGQLTSFAKIVKSEAGLPTPQNPSMIVMQRAEGQWLKLTSDELDKSFGNPQMVDIFALTGGSPVDLSGYYTKPEIDDALAGAGRAITQIQDNASNANIKIGALESDKADKATTYTKTEIETAFSENSAGHQELDSFIREVAVIIGGKLDLKADAATTYTKPEVDEAIAASISGHLSPSQIEELISQVGPVDLTDYAKKNDNNQNLVTNAVVARGYAFGDAASGSNPGLVYTDTNEGYGARLVLDAPAGVQYLVYASDLEQVKARVDTLEGKQAPTVDLSPYITQVDADARYGARTAEAVSLLQGQLQAVFDSIYTRAEADDRYAEKAKTYTKVECDTKFLTLVDLGQYAFRADVYTQRQTDDRFMRIDQAFSKTDFDNQMALMLYSRKQIDDKLIAISPLGSPSINNPALADFKQSVLDEVKKLMSGGKTVPADVAWTKLLNTGSTVAEAKMLNGVVYLRGVVTKSIGAGYIANVCQLPPTIPPPAGTGEFVIPLACKNTSPAIRAFGYATFQPNRQIGVSCDSALNTIWLDGISYPAYD
jgi:hypothetical protein